MKNKYPFLTGLALIFSASLFSQNINELKLKDYYPISIYKTAQSEIRKAKYPIIDVHSHDYPDTEAELDTWVRTMDEVGVEKSIILSYSTGKKFDSIFEKYTRYKNRFDVWCGFDYTGVDKPDWQKRAVEELERCYRKGAKGVGELGDKGLGELYSHPTPGYGIHIDDSRMKPLLEKCAELRLPISIHVAEDEWMYLPADSTNDGLMNAAKWKVDMTKPGILNHDQLVATLENAVKNNPRTTFIACHLANCCADLSKLSRLLDAYPNLYADISARYGEISPIPRAVNAFIEKYQDRILYGTDMGTAKLMYLTTFRILESRDEHFYARTFFNYHWPLYGIGLSDGVIRKLYGENAKRIFKR